MSVVTDTRRAIWGLSAFFLALIVVLEGSLAVYWTRDLKPRLREQARAQASVLAQSQAALLSTALGAEPERRDRELTAALDQLLLLQDPASERPYFDAIRLEVDHEALGAAAGSLDRLTGTPTTDSGFAFDVPLYDRNSDELTGIASFAVNSGFYQVFSEDVRRRLIMQAATMLGLLLGSWIILILFVRLLGRSRARRMGAERALAEHEQKFRRLLDNLDNYFIYGRDARGVLTSVSDSVSRVLPGVPPNLPTSAYAELLTDHPTNQEPRSLIDEPPLERPTTHEIEIHDRNGGVHRLELSEIPIISDDGSVAGVDGIARDVTEQRRFEAELRQARDAAEGANRAKSQFLANMSHEIRTPMNAILGMTTMLQKTGLDDRHRPMLEKLQAAADQLLEVIDGILDLSRLETGKLSLKATDCEVSELLAEVGGTVAARAGAKDLELVFELDPSAPETIRVDGSALKQVLLYLIDNAIKFTNRGEVVASVRRVAIIDGGKCQVEFAVRDTGVGMPAEEIDRIFDPFTQLDESDTRAYGGVGLGLAIARRLVQAMGGEIAVASQPDQGSRFSFVLTAEAGDRQSSASADRPDLKGRRALVVDDNPTARDALQSMLAALRFDVDTAPDGATALARIQAAVSDGRSYELVLLDWKMPGMDGLETLDALRGQLAAASPAVVLVSAYAGEELNRKARAVSVEGVLQKPVGPSALFDAVSEALAQQNPCDRGARSRDEKRDLLLPAGKRALLVEDIETNREVAGELLTGLGVEVGYAENGRVALETLRSERFDIVFMDIQMPEMDGLEATRRIKDNPALARMPVVALTAHAMIGDRQRFLAAGMDDYLSKPVDEASLMKTLLRWLGDAVPEPAEGPPVAAADAQQAEALDRRADESDLLDIDDALRRLSGNREMLLRLLRQLQDRLPEDLARLDSHLSEQDLMSAGKLAHTLKGAAATLSARALADSAAALESQIAERGDLSAARARLTDRADAFMTLDLNRLVARTDPPADRIQGLLRMLDGNDLAAVRAFHELKDEFDDAGLAAALMNPIESLEFHTAARLIRGRQSA